jgi:hypothetical protein
MLELKKREKYRKALSHELKWKREKISRIAEK